MKIKRWVILANVIGATLLLGSLESSISAEEIDFFKLREKVKASTKVQFKELKKEYIGKQVRWEGWVDEVKEKLFGGYNVKIDMDPPGSLSVYDISIDLPFESKDLVLGLQKDSKVSFSGKIKSIYFTFGSLTVYLEDVVFRKPDLRAQIEELEAETQSDKLNIPTMRTKQFKVGLFWITESFLNAKMAEELIFSKSKLFYCRGLEDLLKGRKEMSPDSFTELLRSGYLILYVRYTNASMEDAKWNSLGWPTDPLDIVDDEGNQYNSAKEDIFDLAPAHVFHPTATGVMIKFYRNKKNEPPKYTTIYYCPIGEGTEAFIKIPYQWEDLIEWHNFTQASPVSPITDEEKMREYQTEIQEQIEGLEEATKRLEKILTDEQ